MCGLGEGPYTAAINGPELVRIQVIIEVDEPGQVAAFDAWAEQVGLDLNSLENDGCGCCVNIYTLDTTAADAAALAAQVGVTYLPVWVPRLRRRSPPA